eukprot:TRINITY_DN9358_c0_g2_i1.p1 TRINITY_DN9358_c0_g2~~TRINITY_DN9358_c0_g2_i1.p1  ORF type:complete len:226 (-),score=23.61 TRINITY_DN9358_c0_g2_i1:63-713(-)
MSSFKAQRKQAEKKSKNEVQVPEFPVLVHHIVEGDRGWFGTLGALPHIPTKPSQKTAKGIVPIRKTPPPKKSKVLTAREKRKLHVFDIPEESRVYDLYLSLHTLWKRYVDDVLSPQDTMPTLVEKLKKIDFHGAQIRITRSICPSLVGTTGIVLIETENTYKIITKDNRLLSVPKKGTVFTLFLSSQEVTLFGANFCYKPAVRAARRVKAPSSVQL